MSPVKTLDYASCSLARVGQWRCRVGAPFPLQTHFASRMKYSSYLWVLEFFFVFCHSLQDYTSFFPDIHILTLPLRCWLRPPDWASYPGSNLFMKHHQEDLPKTELNISSQHSNNCWIWPWSLHPPTWQQASTATSQPVLESARSAACPACSQLPSR